MIAVNYWSKSMTICIRRCYVATGFETYKQVNNLCKSEHLLVGVFSCKRSERKRKENFEVPDSSLVGCGTVPTGRRRLSKGEYWLYIEGRAVVL